MPQQIVYSFKDFGHGVFRPHVPILINNPLDKLSKPFKISALLDTGADSCVFPKGIADLTGHNLKGDGVESHISQGVGEQTTSVWKHTFEIKLLSPTDYNKVIWKSKNTLVGCLEHDCTPPLLGTKGFLEYFNIRFNYKTHKIIIELPD